MYMSLKEFGTFLHVSVPASSFCFCSCECCSSLRPTPKCSHWFRRMMMLILSQYWSTSRPSCLSVCVFRACEQRTFKISTLFRVIIPPSFHGCSVPHNNNYLMLLFPVNVDTPSRRSNHWIIWVAAWIWGEQMNYIEIFLMLWFLLQV